MIASTATFCANEKKKKKKKEEVKKEVETDMFFHPH